MKNFDWLCFKPSKKNVINLFLITFYLSTILTLIVVSGLLDQIINSWNFWGNKLIGFLLIYYMTFEFKLWEKLKINYLFYKIGKFLKEKFLFFDKKVKVTVSEDFSSTKKSCFAKNLDYLLTKLNFSKPELKKAKIQNTGLFLLKVPLYFLVFTIIIFWDVFYKNLAPPIMSIIFTTLYFIYKWTGIKFAVNFLKRTVVFNRFINYIESKNLVAILLVIGFTFIFAIMQALKITAIVKFGSGEILLAILLYISAFSLLFISKPYNKVFGNKMLTVKWYKIRYDSLVSLMELFESTNSYKNVMFAIQKMKVIIKDVWILMKSIFNLIKQHLGIGIKDSETLNFFEETQEKRKEIWQKLKSIFVTEKVNKSIISYYKPDDLKEYNQTLLKLTSDEHNLYEAKLYQDIVEKQYLLELLGKVNKTEFRLKHIKAKLIRGMK